MNRSLSFTAKEDTVLHTEPSARSNNSNEMFTKIEFHKVSNIPRTTLKYKMFDSHSSEILVTIFLFLFQFSMDWNKHNYFQQHETNSETNSPKCNWLVIFLEENPQHSLPNLLGPHPIDHRIKGWWDNHIEISQENMDILGHIMAKTMCQEREKCWSKKS